MERKMVLIIAIILLTGLVAVSGYFLVQNQQPVNNTSVNLSISNNTNQISSQSNQDNYIGKTRAKKIAQEFLAEYGVNDYEIREIDLITVNGVALYRVRYWDYYITADGTETGWDEIYIGALNGKISDSYGNMEGHD